MYGSSFFVGCLFYGIIHVSSSSWKSPEILVLGDSLLAPGSSSLVEDMVEWVTPLFQKNVSLNDKVEWINKAIIGSSIETGWKPSITEQYRSVQPYLSSTSLSSSSSWTLFMDGGGNDVLSHERNCRFMDSICWDMLHRVNETLQSFFQEIQTDKLIDSIIYLGFYEIHGLQQVVHEGMVLLSSLCTPQSVPPCCLVDPRNLSIPKQWDGIHPTSQGYQILAKEIMKQCP